MQHEYGSGPEHSNNRGKHGKNSTTFVEKQSIALDMATIMIPRHSKMIPEEADRVLAGLV